MRHSGHSRHFLSRSVFTFTFFYAGLRYYWLSYLFSLNSTVKLPEIDRLPKVDCKQLPFLRHGKKKFRVYVISIVKVVVQ